MELRRLLRQLIIAEIALVVAVVIVELVAERFLPPALREWTNQQADAMGPRDVLIVVMALPLLAALVVSWIGLWRLWRPARWIYLLALIGGLLIEIMMGPSVISGPGAALSTLQCVVTGLIFAVIYLTPLAAAFGRPPAIPPGGFDVSMPAGPSDPGARRL